MSAERYREATGIQVAFVSDVRRAQEHDYGEERKQHGVQQRRPYTAVYERPEAVEPHGERQQEEVVGEESLIDHCPERLRGFHEDA